MLNLLLPSAQGTMCSHRHYLHRSAVEQDSKRDDETALWVIAVIGGQRKNETFKLYLPLLQRINLLRWRRIIGFCYCSIHFYLTNAL